MKCLTIKQPFANLIANNIKTVEVRSWKTNYRGELYIHAGKSIDKEKLKKYNNVIDINDLALGEIIAKCNLVDCIKLDEKFINEYNENNGKKGYIITKEHIGYYGFVLEDIEKINPIPTKGKLSFWEY